MMSCDVTTPPRLRDFGAVCARCHSQQHTTRRYCRATTPGARAAVSCLRSAAWSRRVPRPTAGLPSRFSCQCAGEARVALSVHERQSRGAPPPPLPHPSPREARAVVAGVLTTRRRRHRPCSPWAARRPRGPPGGSLERRLRDGVSSSFSVSIVGPGRTTRVVRNGESIECTRDPAGEITLKIGRSDPRTGEVETVETYAAKDLEAFKEEHREI